MSLEQGGIRHTSILGMTTWNWSAFIWYTEDQERFYPFI